MSDSYFVPSVPLAVDLNPKDGIITNVGPYRHSVIWVGEDEPSTVTYCNNCGSALERQGELKALIDPQQRHIRACARCGVFQGFVSGR
jgi:hypothetical protein